MIHRYRLMICEIRTIIKIYFGKSNNLDYLYAHFIKNLIKQYMTLLPNLIIGNL